MSALSVERVVKNSVLYGYALSQPFAMYMDMFPMVQNNLALEADTLQYGDNSELVGQIQHSLNHLGFYDDDIDGVIGLFNERALKRFQSAHKLCITLTGE